MQLLLHRLPTLDSVFGCKSTGLVIGYEVVGSAFHHFSGSSSEESRQAIIIHLEENDFLGQKMNYLFSTHHWWNSNIQLEVPRCSAVLVLLIETLGMEGGVGAKKRIFGQEESLQGPNTVC